ncbi:MAG: hypothetical protein CMO55_02575 [Verrucomicrobiales bacterium]|nr:hypothetical protein [Verrucomicrobiales bacterium]
MSSLPNPDSSALSLYKNESILVERYGSLSSRFSPCPVVGSGWIEVVSPSKGEEDTFRLFLKDDGSKPPQWQHSRQVGDIDLARWVLAEFKRDRAERRFWHYSGLYSDRNFETYYREELPLRLVMKIWGDAFGMMRGLAYFRTPDLPTFADHEVDALCKYLKQPMAPCQTRPSIDYILEADIPGFGVA